MSSARIIVPDTNLFFECKRLEDLPWVDLGADVLEIVLTKPVLDQIDQHKKRNGRTKRRALDTFKRLRPILLGQREALLIKETGPRVTLCLATAISPSKRHGSALDLQNTDDRLVALVTRLVDEGRNALLVTHDAGPAATASTLDVPYFLIPDEWLRPAEESQEAKRIRQLEREINRYAAQEPVLTLKSVLGHNEVAVFRHDLPIKTRLDGTEIEMAIERLKAAHPPTTDFATPPSPQPRLKLGSLFAEDEVEWTPPSEAEQKTYLEERYPAWLDACREMLRTLHEHLPDADPCYVGFDLENIGSRPALNVRVELRVDGSAMIVRERSNGEDDEDDEEASETESRADQRETRLVLPRSPSAPAWQKKVVKKAADVTGVGRTAKEFTALQDRLTSPYLRTIMRDLERPVGVLRQLEDHQRRIGALGIGHATPLGYNLPSISALARHDPEAFYYDGWSPDLPVSAGALTCDRFRHQSGAHSFAYRIEFPDEEARAASILCTVHAENLTDPVQRRLRVEQVQVPTKPIELLEALLVGAGVPQLDSDSGSQQSAANDVEC